MKKSVLLFAAMLITAITSYAADVTGYDQEVVDSLCTNIKFQPADWKTMVKQTNYALDDAEKATNKQKWCEDNKQEVVSMMGMLMYLGMSSTAYPNQYPEDLRNEIKALIQRGDKIIPTLQGN